MNGDFYLALRSVEFQSAEQRMVGEPVAGGKFFLTTTLGGSGAGSKNNLRVFPLFPARLVPFSMQ
jgi:hypothetical protein